MKRLLAILLLIPGLSFGLTFKDGKQVGEGISLNFGKNSMGWDVSCQVNKGSITQNKDILIFKTSENTNVFYNQISSRGWSVLCFNFGWFLVWLNSR